MSGNSERGASGPECGGCGRLHREPSEHDLCEAQEAQGNLCRVHQNSLDESQLSIEEEEGPSDTFESQTMFLDGSGVIPQVHGAHRAVPSLQSISEQCVANFTKRGLRSPHIQQYTLYVAKDDQNRQKVCKEVGTYERMEEGVEMPSVDAARDNPDDYYNWRFKIQDSVDVAVKYDREKIKAILPQEARSRRITAQELNQQSHLAMLCQLKASDFCRVQMAFKAQNPRMETTAEVEVILNGFHNGQAVTTSSRRFALKFDPLEAQSTQQALAPVDKSMPPRDSNILTENGVNIYQGIREFNLVILGLSQEKVLHKDDMAMLGATDMEGRVRVLLDILKRRGNVMGIFIDVLRETKNDSNKWLATQLSAQRFG